MKRIVLCMMITISVFSFIGCSHEQTVSKPYSSTQPSPNPTASLSPTASTSPKNELQMPRAIGKTANGEILLVPKGQETIEQLGAPSCYGNAEDYSFKAEYQLVFRNMEGKEELLSAPKIDTLIAPQNKQIELPTLQFPDFAAVTLAPKYTDCHGVSFYLIGTTGKGAFLFHFKTSDGIFNQFNYAPGTQPKMMNGKLVVEQGAAPGYEGPKQLYFEPDVQHQTMNLVKTE